MYYCAMNSLSTSVDCGPPPAPRNGSLESYTSTTEGSVVFYSCEPGLVPEMRMMSVCTGAGWNPNPGALGCSVGMLQGLLVRYLIFVSLVPSPSDCSIDCLQY